MTYAETVNHHHYVSVRDGARSGLLLGPYGTHAEALANVERARVEASKVNDDAHWFTYGTARVHTRAPRPGRLNARIGLVAG